MEQTGLDPLHLEVSAEGASAEDLDQITREFPSELKDTEKEVLDRLSRSRRR